MAYKKFSTTKATALAAAASASATSIELVDGSSYPDPAVGGNGPYTLLLAYGSDREEIVTVTAKPSANTLTVTRGQDGSAATTKNIGDIVVHGVSKRDWEDMAPLASPALTGNPTAPTPAAGDNDTSIATTAFVQQQVPIGTIVMWGATAAPTGWHLCDGTAHNSAALAALTGSAMTPDLRGRFVVAAGGGYSQGDTGGAASVTLTTAQMPSHSHGGKTADEDATHGHTGITSDAGSHVHAATREEVGGADPSNTNDSARNATGLPYTLTGAAGLHNHAFSTTIQNANHKHVIQPEGGGQAHENRPPYYALTFIIKKA